MTALLLLAALAAQTASTITGRVVADDSGKPIVNARVSVTTTSGLAAPVTLTDADGRFTLPRSTDARAALAVAKTGYTRADAPAGDGAIEIRLKRAGVISGRVVDEFGEPVENVRVVAQRDPKARLALADGVSTDDRGEYRLVGLPAGSFVVAVTRVFGMIDPATLRPRDPETTFYPGTASPDEATALKLEAGDEQRRIDFVVRARRPDPPPLMLFRAAQNAGQPSRSGPAPNGVIRGRVSDTDGRPVPHATVQLHSPADVMQWQGMLADDRGTFEFRGVAAGRFFLQAEKSGYTIDQQRTTITDGGASEPIDFRIARFGVVTGRIVDELGDPVERVSVEVMDIHYEAGRRRLGRAGQPQLTDDEGRFRIFGLRSGQYLVSAVAHGVASVELPGYVRAFYPGTTSPADARTVAIGPAAEIGGVDFALSRARTFLVAGRILDAGGSPTTGGTLQLTPAPGASGLAGAAVGARIGANGAFEFPNVTPGAYVIRADRGRKNGWSEGEFGAIPVVVADADVTGLVVATSTGSMIHGRLRFDTSGDRTPAPASIEIRPMPVDFDLSPSQPATADIHDDGSFDMAGINGPRRIEVTRVPSGWALDAVRIGGIDVTDRPVPFGKAEQSQRDVEIVLTDRVSELTGTTSDDSDQPVTDVAVVVFSTDRSRWYEQSRFVRHTVSGARGEFAIEGLPFGTYYVASIARMEDEAWRDPAILEALISRAVTVVVREGQRQTVRVRSR